MSLDWHWSGNGLGQRVWRLPNAIAVTGPAPERFGICIFRAASDSYLVRMVWNDMQFGWPRLTRRELLESSLTILLKALGTSLEYLLDQPVQELSITPS